LVNYDWPGNVRQLENLIERCIVISNEKEINDEILSEALFRTPAYKTIIEQRNDDEIPDNSGVLKNIEYDTIKKVLQETNGNRKLAAEKLGISVTTLWRRLKKLEEQ
ncbi:MAG: winged helix-turn-helix transcriptional regulator, partial [Tissierellia bacterium]|nr:winged helix-turn-helix transcriptional regulator [Tissierellia bacterium]